NHADRPDYATAVGINLVGCRGNIVSTACSHRLNGRGDIFFLLITDALDFAVDFLRRSNPATRRIYMDDDRLDGIVVGQLAQLIHSFCGTQDDSVEIDDTDLLPEQACPLAGCAAENQKHQRKHGQNEEEECSSSD